MQYFRVENIVHEIKDNIFFIEDKGKKETDKEEDEEKVKKKIRKRRWERDLLGNLRIIE